jgi:hypothetical protein
MEVVGCQPYAPVAFTPGDIPGTCCCYTLIVPQGHSAAGRIKSTKNSNDAIGNRTRDLPACSAVPQSTAPPHMYTVPNMADVQNFQAGMNKIKSHRSCTRGPYVSAVLVFPSL